MEAIVAFVGAWAWVLTRTGLEVLRDIRKKQKYYDEYGVLPIFASDRDIYLRHEAYNRYQGTEYRGDQP